MILGENYINSNMIFIVAILVVCIFLCFEYDRVKNQQTKSPTVIKEDPVKNLKYTGIILSVVLGLYILTFIMVIAKRGLQIDSFAFDLLTGIAMIVLAFAFIYAVITVGLTFADNYYNKDLFPYLLLITLGLLVVMYLVGNTIGYSIPIEKEKSIESTTSMENTKKTLPSRLSSVTRSSVTRSSVPKAATSTPKGSASKATLTRESSIKDLAPQ